MSDLTPPESWETLGHANYWLDRFIKETDGPTRYQDLFHLPPLIFDQIQDGWKTKIVLKKEFAGDPDFLAEFIKCERMPPAQRERYRNPSEVLRGFPYYEEDDDED